MLLIKYSIVKKLSDSGGDTVVGGWTVEPES